MKYLSKLTLFPAIVMVVLASLIVRTGIVSAAPVTKCKHWKIISSPDPSVSSNSLSGVAAISADSAWAVGTYDSNFNGLQTLTEQWDGTQWNVVPSPNQPGADTPNYLYGVTAISANDAWAVGDYAPNGTGTFYTLTLHWDGTQWSIIPSSNPSSTGFNQLFGVRATSTDDVWAVGDYEAKDGSAKTLIEHWNGKRWKVISSPNSAFALNQLQAVTSTSANDVWAVGYYGPPNSASLQTLIEHWNGTQWSIVPSPDPGIGDNLFGVTALSATNAWAVGYTLGSNSGGTLIEHWDGTQWNVVSSPNPANGTGSLTSVTALSNNNIWTVGYSLVQDTPFSLTLIEHWNGTTWSIIPSPSPGPESNNLSGVAGLSGAKQVWAVGVFTDSSGAYQNLVESNC